MLKPVPDSTSRPHRFTPRLDRRSATRFSPFRMTPCYLTAPAEGIGASALVYNMSAQGVGIVGSPWISPGTVVQVELINAGCTFVLTLDMRVTRVEAASSGGHYLGGQFTRKLTYDELLPFLI
jgi:hypothetical protein